MSHFEIMECAVDSPGHSWPLGHYWLIVALYIRHICTITKGSGFPILSAFTGVVMMTATAVGVGAVAGSSHRGLSALVSRGEKTLAVLTFLLPAIEERRAGQGS